MRLCRSSFLTLPRFLLSSPPPRPSSIAHPSPPSPPPPPSQIPHLRPFHLSHPSPQASSPHQPAHIDPSPYEDQERGPFSDKILRLRDEIASLSDDELRQMSAALRKKLGLPEPVAMPAGLSMMPAGAMGWGDDAGGQASAEERPPEKTSFDVKLEKFDAASKIKVIKEVRAITSLGLKEAKDLVEKTPSVIKTGVSKEEATQVMEKLKVVGATVTME